MSEKILDYLSSIEYSIFQQLVLSSAGKLHEDVNQLYGRHRYEFHLHLTNDILQKSLFSIANLNIDDAKILTFVSAFHDTIEDTRNSYSSIQRIAVDFLESEKNSIIAADAVLALTSNKGKNRKEREGIDYFNGILNTPYAPIIKVCDRIANMYFSKVSNNTSLLSMYKKELNDFINYFKQDSEWPFSVPPQLLEKLTKI